MPVFNAQQIKEINTLIAEVEKAIAPACEIGARDKSIVSQLLKTNKEAKKAHYFACKREYSDAIVTHFVKEKAVKKSRYHMNNQASVFVLK